MRYLKGTIDYGPRYVSDREIILQGYIDLDWAGSVKDWKSTSRCCFSMGSAMILWLREEEDLYGTQFHRGRVCGSWW
jgi:hypothetical protein